jgi:hypothetical protein
MEELSEPVCPECEEPLSRIAPRREKTNDGKYVYRGMKLYCKNGGCSNCDSASIQRPSALIQRPITLCEHPEDKRSHVPGNEHIEYCTLCGVLSPETQNGYDSKKAPWS